MVLTLETSKDTFQVRHPHCVE